MKLAKRASMIRFSLILVPVFVLLSLQLTGSANAFGFNFDTTPPTIGTPSIQPSSPGPSDPVTISVNVRDSDSPVKNVSIFYSTDSWQSVNKTVVASYNNNTQVATAQIPAQPSSVRINYYVVAFDPSGNRGVNHNSGSYFAYSVSAQSSLSTWLLVAVAVSIGCALLAVGFFVRRRRNGQPKS